MPDVLRAIDAEASSGAAAARRACCIEFEAANQSPQNRAPAPIRESMPSPSTRISTPTKTESSESADVRNAPIAPTILVAMMLPAEPYTPKIAEKVTNIPEHLLASEILRGP